MTVPVSHSLHLLSVMNYTTTELRSLLLVLLGTILTSNQWLKRYPHLTLRLRSSFFLEETSLKCTEVLEQCNGPRLAPFAQKLALG